MMIRARRCPPVDDVPSIESELRVSSAIIEVGSYDWSPLVERTLHVDQHTLSVTLTPPHAYARGCYAVNGNEPLVDIGDMILVPACIPFRCCASGGPIRFVRCRYEPAWFEKLTGFAPHWESDVLSACIDIKSPALYSNMLRLAHEAVSPGLRAEILVEAICMTTAVELARYIKASIPQPGVKSGGLAPWQLRRVLDYIDANPGPSATATEELAALCGVSSRHLRRQFKQTLGRTVSSYRRDVCLEKAKALLRDTERPIKTIADDLGFTGVGTFGSLFRSAMGITPRVFRQQFAGALLRPDGSKP
jgi:AraC family transcriptional regulator